MIRMRLSIAALALTSLFAADAARAQDEPPAVIPIVLPPASAPVPALKYRLLPERETLVPGNAAVFYHRAIETWVERHGRGGEGPLSEWISGHLEAIPRAQANQWIQQNQFVLRELELGARRRECDWEFESRPEGVNLLIGEIQWMRTLGRLVALRARVAVLDKKLDEAVHWLQTGYAMGRHVADGPTLIQALVGMSCCLSLNKPMEDVIQAAGTPSLYWALADRPRPFIDLAGALEFERLLPEREVPRLRKLDGLPWSVEEGRAFADEVETKLYAFAGWNASPSAEQHAPPERYWRNRFGMAAMVAQAYPGAKRALVARGRSPAQVEAMPAIQVVFLEAYTDYQVRRDEVFKWSGLPIYQAYDLISASNAKLKTPEVQSKPLLNLLCSVVVSFQGASLAQARLDRQLDAFECIEAIRLYAATHRRLPDRLEDIAEAPAPLDPMTGRPFEYRLEGGRASLSAPVAPPGFQHPSFGLRYELTLAQ
jgi:hypothetical protein